MGSYSVIAQNVLVNPGKHLRAKQNAERLHGASHPNGLEYDEQSPLLQGIPYRRKQQEESCHFQ